MNIQKNRGAGFQNVVPISAGSSEMVFQELVRSGMIAVSVFFRRKPTRSGLSWQLVESFRNEEGQPRQRIVVCLGDASLPGERERKLIAKVLERKLRHPQDFFSGSPEMVSLSEATAGWIDRIYRRIIRDGRYCKVQPVGDTGDLSSASSCDFPCEGDKTSGALLEDVLVDDIEHEHSAMLGPLLPVKAAWESLGISQCLRELGFGKRQIVIKTRVKFGGTNAK